MASECICDYTPATVYRKSVRKARKEHRCYECQGKILPGEQHEYVFAIWEGDVNAVRTCSRCIAVRDFVVAHVPCSCWTHGNMLEDIREEVDAYWPDAPGLAMGYLRRLLAVERAVGRRVKKPMG